MFRDGGDLSPRLLLSLISNLPTDGALYASMRGGKQFRGWDVDRYALVSLLNAQRAGNHITLMVNRDPKKPKPKPPAPFPTPDSEERKSAAKPGSFAAIAASMLKAQRRKKEGSSGS